MSFFTHGFWCPFDWPQCPSQISLFCLNPLTMVPEISRAGVYGECTVKAKSARIQWVNILVPFSRSSYSCAVIKECALATKMTKFRVCMVKFKYLVVLILTSGFVPNIQILPHACSYFVILRQRKTSAVLYLCLSGISCLLHLSKILWFELRLFPFLITFRWKKSHSNHWNTFKYTEHELNSKWPVLYQ